MKYVLWVQDMDRAVRFYTAAIGLDQRFVTPGWSELAWGDAIIALHGGAEDLERQTGLSFQVDDLDCACEILQKHGGKIIDPPKLREDEPIKLSTAIDTEGNQFMLTQYLG